MYIKGLQCSLRLFKAETAFVFCITSHAHSMLHVIRVRSCKYVATLKLYSVILLNCFDIVFLLVQNSRSG